MRLLNVRHQLYSLQFSLLRHCVKQKKPSNGMQAMAVMVSQYYFGQRRYSTSNVAAADAPPIKSNGRLPANGPGLKEFIIAGRKPALVAQQSTRNNPIVPENTVPYLDALDFDGRGRKVFFEVYGCQMNVNDTEIVWSILKNNGYEKVDSADVADIVLLMTCAIREKAETKVI